MNEELKPCPFCGGEAKMEEVTRHISNNIIVIKCQCCGASTKVYNEKNNVGAYHAWNRRAGDDS